MGLKVHRGELAAELLKGHALDLADASLGEVKHLGDGSMASFHAIPAAVDCALSIQDAFRAHNDNGDLPIRVRIGLHAVEPVAEGNDLFGAVVQMASRICDLAQANQILVSDEVRLACEGAGLSFAPTGPERLKGFANPVRLFIPSR